MLNAILEGKAGRLHADGGQSHSWRALFKFNEDLVTASVFERLSYLKEHIAWRLLVEAAEGQLDPYRCVEFHEFEYWPKWENTDATRYTEPDLFLTARLGDPPSTVHVIVEAKYGGGIQYENQWVSELQAWQENHDDEPVDQIILIAVGGNPPKGEREALGRRFLDRAQSVSKNSTTIKLVMIEWNDITRACSVVKEDVESRRDLRIIEDMVEALRLSGHYHRIIPKQLESLDRPRNADMSFNALSASINARRNAR